MYYKFRLKSENWKFRETVYMKKNEKFSKVTGFCGLSRGLGLSKYQKSFGLGKKRSFQKKKKKSEIKMFWH